MVPRIRIYSHIADYNDKTITATLLALKRCLASNKANVQSAKVNTARTFTKIPV